MERELCFILVDAPIALTHKFLFEGKGAVLRIL